ncbi:MAG TPA: hypothetical protein P5080_03630 [Candidatus Paceibacterota bacterium]|nr:hypothetical protein [Candidatus Pacearchaeota archaeon]HRZ51065.1 hypothetical protein [Candidatus Paceibacterota bacterium]HSA36776.1 hypothetical protein [Candidatus Paceibacterota bacterium]
MLEGLSIEQKRVAKIIAGVIVLLILAAVVLPRMQQPVEDTASKIAEKVIPPNETKEEKVRVVEREVVVPGPINVSDDVKSYSEIQVLKLLNNRDPDDDAHRYTKGDMRAATGTEFSEFLAALDSSQAGTGVAKAMDAIQSAFWNNPEKSRHKIGAGYMVTRDDYGDRCYALVLVMTGSKPAIAAVSATSTDPETDWFIWTGENTPGSRGAYIITLTSG